jgi:O-antigen/teichoic acid export membrane protein
VFVVSASQRAAIVRAGTDWDDVFVARLTRLTIAAGTVVALGLAVVDPVAIPLLFGQAYEPAVRLSYLLQPGLPRCLMSRGPGALLRCLI